MKFRVKLKTTVTAWAVVNVNEHAYPGLDDTGLRELAADDAVLLHDRVLINPLAAAGLEHGPIELAHEELDENVEVVG